MKTKVKKTKKTGAKYLRELVLWMNLRAETKNEDKSVLTLIGEFNDYQRKQGNF